MGRDCKDNGDDYDDDLEYDDEWAAEIMKDIEDWRAGRLETVSLDELKAKLGLADNEGSSNAGNSRSD